MDMRQRIIEKNAEKYFYRFSLQERIQHILLFSFTITLFLTGFSLRLQEEWWAPGLYNALGGPSIVPTIHRLTGIGFFTLFIFHLTTVISLFRDTRLQRLKEEGKATPANIIKEMLSMEMVPNIQDLKDIINHILYLLYIKDSPPHYGRMTWKEKLDYLALYWGIPIVAISGLLLWQRDIATKIVPGIILNVAYLMHGYEATLALLSIAGFHWYNVHYSPEKFPMATVFLTGYLSEEEMVDEHFGEYETVMNEQGRGEELKSHHDIRPSGMIEVLLYKAFSVSLMLLVIWYTFLATRYIYYYPTPSSIGAFAQTKETGDSRKITTNASFHSAAITAGRDGFSPCAGCHTEVPHAEAKEGIEPFLNMHASFIACATCHVKEEETPTFRWQDMKTGSFFDKMPPQAFEKRGVFGAKITSGILKDGNFEPFRGDTGKTAGDELEKRNHRNISKKPLTCTDCHKKDGGYIPFESLGYTPERMKEITGKEITPVIEGYQKILEEEKSE